MPGLSLCARRSALVQVIMQMNHHSLINPTLAPPAYHPIFHRIKERSTPPSPPVSEVAEIHEIQWEKRFIKCSYAMVRLT